MLLGILLITLGNIFVWQAEEQTTQFFTGWVFGAVILSGSGSAPKPLNAVLAGISTFFLIENEQMVTTKPKKLNCENGVEKIIGGARRCVCTPPYIGELCDQCPEGAVVFGENNDMCESCHYMYMFPFCKDLQPGYQTVTKSLDNKPEVKKCNEGWKPSCRHSNPLALIANPKTYGEVEGVRNELYDMDESSCVDNGGTVYCDKCNEGRAGPFCCPDGKYGQGCTQDVPTCTQKLDYLAALAGNEIPEGYNLVEPDICYTLGDDDCSCGGEFIGDNLCPSNMCVRGKCTDLGRVPEYDFRCDCDIGVGPDCETPTCYGGTRMWAGKGVCRCNAQHLDSYNGITFDSCNIQADGECYPGLFGDHCQECQCVVDKIDAFNTKQCEKNMYGVFDRDFRTKDYTRDRGQECIDSGICTNEPDDCGVVEDGADRCLLFTNPETFSAILFSGDNCTDTTDSKCRSWEPCQPR